MYAEHKLIWSTKGAALIPEMLFRLTARILTPKSEKCSYPLEWLQHNQPDQLTRVLNDDLKPNLEHSMMALCLPIHTHFILILYLHIMFWWDEILQV